MLKSDARRLGLTFTNYAGHCSFKTDTVRGQCWRKTRAYRSMIIGKDGITRNLFRCWQHWDKP